MTATFTTSWEWDVTYQDLLELFEPLEKQLEAFRAWKPTMPIKGNMGERIVEWQKSLGRIEQQFSKFQKKYQDLQDYKDLKRDELISSLKSRLENCEIILSDFRKNIEVEGRKLLSSRANLQWRRKIFHTFSGLFGLWLYAYSGFSDRSVILFLATCFSGAVMTEVVRRVWPHTNEALCRRMGAIMRERERTQISSATWYMGSMLVVFLLFPKYIAIPVLFYIAVGDTVAGIVGSKWGRHYLARHVSVEGFAAAWVSGFLGTFLFMKTGIEGFQLSGGVLWLVSFLGATIGAGSESVLKKWDDNLTIPLLSAPLLWVVIELTKNLSQ